MIEQMDLEANIRTALEEEGPVGTTTTVPGAAGTTSTTAMGATPGS